MNVEVTAGQQELTRVQQRVALHPSAWSHREVVVVTPGKGPIPVADAIDDQLIGTRSRYLSGTTIWYLVTEVRRGPRDGQVLTQHRPTCEIELGGQRLPISPLQVRAQAAAGQGPSTARCLIRTALAVAPGSEQVPVHSPSTWQPGRCRASIEESRCQIFQLLS